MRYYMLVFMSLSSLATLRSFFKEKRTTVDIWGSLVGTALTAYAFYCVTRLF